MNASDKLQLIDYLRKVKDKGIHKVYLHWTAGRYNQVFENYHINIKGDGEVYFTTSNLLARKSHTWNRNTGAIGIALCCAYNAQFPHDFGVYPPTKEQIETAAEVMAIICAELNIPLDAQNIMTHAEAAALDDYGPGSGDPHTRWDLYQLRDFDGTWKPGGDVLRGKAAWYKERI